MFYSFLVEMKNDKYKALEKSTETRSTFTLVSPQSLPVLPVLSGNTPVLSGNTPVLSGNIHQCCPGIHLCYI